MASRANKMALSQSRSGKPHRYSRWAHRVGRAMESRAIPKSTATIQNGCGKNRPSARPLNSESNDRATARYCTDGCPKHIAIPEYFHLYNERFNTQKYQENLESFKKLTQTNGKPSDCIACRACEDKCPQHLKITELLKKVTRQFE